MTVRPSLNHVKLRDKMLILYFLCVFIPIVITNIIFYQMTTNNVKNQRLQEIELAVEQIKNEFRSEVEDAVSISSVFFTDYMLNEIIEQDYDAAIEYVEAYDAYLRRILNSYTPVYNSVQAITIYVDNPTMLHSGGVSYISPEVKQSEWYTQLMSIPHSRPILIRTDKGGVRETFSVIRKMDYFDLQSKREKLLKIDLRIDTVRQIFNNLNMQGNMYLLNGNGEIEFSTDPGLEWRQQVIRYADIAMPADTVSFASDMGPANYFQDWSIIGTVSESEVFDKVQQSRHFVIVLACLNMIFPTLIIIWITRSLNVRLIRILRHMKKVKHQHFDVITDVESRDEIGQLTNEFNRMTLQIKRLIEDVYRVDIQKKDLELERRRAQLNALQSQINPHFLFNSLETIRMRSLMKDEDETAKIIHNMAKIFRNSLAWKKDWITVREELELIESFLEIQQYRFGDKLSYRIDVDKDAYDASIPKMTFLPFVENASIHGVESLKAGGLIKLAITVNDRELMFTLSDNGAGIGEEQIRRFYSYVRGDGEMGDRVGIQNVIYRLKLYYGDKFDIEFISKPGKGTTIIIRLPHSQPRPI